MLFKKFPGLVRVVHDLRCQRLEIGELPLRTQIVKELHPDFLPIEISVKVQDEPFHSDQSAPILHGGTDANIGHSGVGLLIKMDTGHIHPIGGDDDPSFKGQVHRRKAQDVPQLLAVFHSVGEHMGVPQQVVGLGDLALGQQFADLGGMNLNAVQLHHTDDLAADAQLLAFLLQPFRLPCPLAPK